MPNEPHQLPRPTDAELEILTVLWSLGPSTVRDVHEAIVRRKPAQYTTVLKTLQIMAEKGLVERDEKQRAHIYSASRPQEWTQQQLAGDLLQRAFGGSAKSLMLGALSSQRASKKELAELRKFLEEYEKGDDMSQLGAWIHTPIAQALGWTLVHFLWEGALLAALAMALLRILRAAPARRRYAVACLTLAAMPLAFAATAIVMWLRQPAPVRPLLLTAPLAPLSLAMAAPLPAPPFSFAALLDRLPWLVPVWLVGVAFCYLRGLAGWISVQRLRRRGVCAAPAEWQARLNELAARLRIARPVALLESCFTDTPVLIGYLRPVVLLPLGCLTGLSAAQVECILLHELAHVVRHDYLVNLLQSVVEGLLFYHPAVWWVSRTVRAERENCCDDLAVELVGDARSYAATLAALEHRRALAPEAALAATGGNLMKRIQRLTMETRGRRTSATSAVSAGLLLVMFAAALAAVPVKFPLTRHSRIPGVALTPQPQRKLGAPKALPDPYRKWLNEDVAYIITDAERAEFRNLSTDLERDQFIDQFWIQRGSAFKAEHYRRIAYANQHFAWQTLPGWKTDRGRIYITYGAPDEIDDHSQAKVPTQQWRYRYIDSIGYDVIISFEGPDYRMTMDPSGKQAALNLPPPIALPYRKWIDEDVAYIITNELRSAFLKLEDDSDREKFIENFWLVRDPTPATVENEYKEEHYRRIAYSNEHFASGIPGWKTDRGRIYITYGPPDTVAASGCCSIKWVYRYIEGMGSNVTLDFEDQKGTGDFHLTSDPGVAQNGGNPFAKVFVSHEAQAVSVIVPNKVTPSGTISPGDLLAVTFAAPDDADREQAIAAKRAECEALLSKYRPSYPGVIECSNQVRAMEAGRPTGTTLESLRGEQGRVETHVTVGADGRIALPGAGAFSAAGLTAAQLESAIGGNASVQIQESRSQMVTVVVPIGASPDTFHVFGEVTTPSRRVVQAFEQEASGQLAVARALPLRAGSYRLVVVIKDMKTGSVRNSELDFTVD